MRPFVVVSVPTLILALACGGEAPSEPVPAPPVPDADPVLGSAGTIDASAPSKLPPITVDDGDRGPDCTIADPGAWQPMLAATQTNGTAPVVVRGKHGLAETMRFHDGTELRVVRGGCDHAGESWMVTPVPTGPHIAEMRALLNRVDLRDPTEQPSLLPCLGDENEGQEQGFGCGDAYVSKSVTADVLDFTWSFAL